MTDEQEQPVSLSATIRDILAERQRRQFERFFPVDTDADAVDDGDDAA